MSLVSELKRRNVFKVAVAYAVVAWILIEISATVFPIFKLPEWTLTFVTLLLILGFPVAMLLTWAYELTPDGMKKTHAVPLSESITNVTGRKLDFLIIGVLVLAVGFFLIRDYLPQDSVPEVVVQEEVVEVEPAPESLAPVAQEEKRDVLPNSVAVLPFENLSPDQDDAYFATGIHDEILNQLVKLSALNVIARTSVLRYAESDKTISEIANELNVQTVMEGSVRYSGNRVRITAQLIDADTGTHLWSDTYEREFDDIFAIESDVAMNVANALEAEFSLEEQASIESIPTDSVEAYVLYLRALDDGREAFQLLTQAIELDPDFTLAYVLRAERTAQGLNIVAGSQDEYESRRAQWESSALADVAKALNLDPNLARTHAVLGRIHAWNWRGREARASYDMALELAPNDPEILGYAAAFYSWVRQHEKSVLLAQRAAELDPTNIGHQVLLAQGLLQTGDREAADLIYQKILETNPRQGAARRQLAVSAELRGDTAEAERHIRIIEAGLGDSNLAPIAGIASRYRQLGLYDDAARMLERFENLAIEGHVSAISRMDASLAHGDEEEALHWLRIAVENKEPYVAFSRTIAIKENGTVNPTLDIPEFAELREQLGFTDL